ncbi:maleylpyruvate isomerase family mycothiol-dependent enzyme [Actinophytocola glycyrrhizae]|uniref:Maleylpyruvate isomerase family mycothiol-dependent enzyme n=1 Tax=Actinophytocola glycyrrhizae TaxID=2044873 RepID=A0ABV9SBK2_9PSEU
MDTKLYEVGTPTLRGERVPNHESYRYVRGSVLELLRAPRVVEDPVVPSCPEWTLRGLVTHLVGVAATSIGRLSGYPSAQPSSSSDMDIPELLAAWDRLGAEVDVLLAERGGRTGSILAMDAFTHELDIRYAIGAALPREHPAFAGAFEVLANGFAAAVSDHGLPALRLSTVSTQWIVGDGAPAATLTADRYDLYRSLAGRRSHAQITALDWDRGSHRWLPAFTWGPFTPPATPVEPVTGRLRLSS